MKIDKLPDGIFISMNKQEALATIKSLATQLEKNSPNVGREEMTTDDGNYFSIGVSDEREKDLSACLDVHIIEVGD